MAFWGFRPARGDNIGKIYQKRETLLLGAVVLNLIFKQPAGKGSPGFRVAREADVREGWIKIHGSQAGE